MVLNEIARNETVQLGMAMMQFHGSSAQVISGPPNFGLFDASRDEALATFMRVGKLLSPWDDSWTARLKEISERQQDRQTQIGSTGLTDRGIVDLIQKYETAKREWEEAEKLKAKKNNAPS